MLAVAAHTLKLEYTEKVRRAKYTEKVRRAMHKNDRLSGAPYWKTTHGMEYITG